MKILMNFGDPYHDGHGRSATIIVEAPSINSITEAENAMVKEYPHIMMQFAQECKNPCPGEIVWDALYKSNYPVERLIEKCDDVHWNEKTFDEIYEEVRQNGYDHGPFTIEFIIDAYLWLLRYYGAEIYEEPVPEYNVSIGYGCFYY